MDWQILLLIAEWSHFRVAVTYFRPNTLPTHCLLEKSIFNFRYVRLSDLDIPRCKMAKLFAASDLGLYCLPIHLSGVSGLIAECYCTCLFVCVEVLRPSQPNGVMSSAVSYLTTRLLGRLSPLSG